MTIEQSELREKIAREFRLAIAACDPRSGATRLLRMQRERISYLHADVVMAMLPAERKVQT
jgi:hypothetical protein